MTEIFSQDVNMNSVSILFMSGSHDCGWISHDRIKTACIITYSLYNYLLYIITVYVNIIMMTIHLLSNIYFIKYFGVRKDAINGLFSSCLFSCVVLELSVSSID